MSTNATRDELNQSVNRADGSMEARKVLPVRLVPRRYSVYRFFRHEHEADALVRGSLWISTLEACRRYEDPLRGDQGEGLQRYIVPDMVDADSRNPEVCEMLARGGIDATNSIGTVINVENIKQLSDAFVLCTTLHFDPELLGETFGPYCVEIKDPNGFMVAATTALCATTKIVQAQLGSVKYRSRIYTGLEKEPGPLGFVKPPDVYGPQKEFRLLWLTPLGKGITPMAVDVPYAAKCCRRLA